MTQGICLVSFNVLNKTHLLSNKEARGFALGLMNTAPPSTVFTRLVLSHTAVERSPWSLTTITSCHKLRVFVSEAPFTPEEFQQMMNFSPHISAEEMEAHMARFRRFEFQK